MGLKHRPEVRQVLQCDYKGSIMPEMNKVRPVVVMAYSPARPGLCPIVPFSSTPPDTLQDWHHPLTPASSWDKRHRWAKCDMAQQVSMQRLDRWRLGTYGGKRQYLSRFLITLDDYRAIQRGILEAFGMRVQ